MKVITVIRDNMMSAKYEFYMADNNHKEILHQLGAEFVSLDRISSIVDEGGMLPIFGIVPWKHHVLLHSE